jgi:hypothetical protein
MLINQPTAAPTRKLTWATLAAIGSSIAADIAVSALPVMGAVDPAELELFLEMAIVGVVTFATGYMVRDRG